MDNKLIKRNSCYIMQPTCYEIKCDTCGGENITWSEYEGHIWCYDCNIDTVGTGGVFDGPIPLGVSEIFGISFDKYDITTGKRLYIKVTDDGKVVWE